MTKGRLALSNHAADFSAFFASEIEFVKPHYKSMLFKITDHREWFWWNHYAWPGCWRL